MAFKAQLIFDAGNYNSSWLPHYGGDFEFTYRAKKFGYKVVLDPKKRVYIDEKQTGLNSRFIKLTFKDRLKSLFVIRSSSNLLTAVKFSILVAPVRSQPFNLMALFAKAFIRAFFVRPK